MQAPRDLIDLGHEKAVETAIQRYRTAPKGQKRKRARDVTKARTEQLRYELGLKRRGKDMAA